MKITEISKNIIYYITTDEEWFNYYTRHSKDCWTVTMGESEESIYDNDKIKELEVLFNKWIEIKKLLLMNDKENSKFDAPYTNKLTVIEAIKSHIKTINIVKDLVKLGFTIKFYSNPSLDVDGTFIRTCINKDIPQCMNVMFRLLKGNSYVDNTTLDDLLEYLERMLKRKVKYVRKA